jgi:hypothetical protein
MPQAGHESIVLFLVTFSPSGLTSLTAHAVTVVTTTAATTAYKTVFLIFMWLIKLQVEDIEGRSDLPVNGCNRFVIFFKYFSFCF